MKVDMDILKNKKVMIIAIAALAVMMLLLIVGIFLINKKENKGTDLMNNDNTELNTGNYSQNFMLTFNNEIPEGLENVISIQHLELDKQGKYQINANIPQIKIETEAVATINKEIYDTFKGKIMQLVNIKNDSSKYTIYNVDVATYYSDDIISLGIKCILKEGSSAQRLIVKAYNYDMKNDIIIDINEFTERKKLDTEKLQTKIYEKVEQEIKRVETLKAQGYDIYTRASQDTMYKIDNIDNFMIDGKNKVLYVIYAYGNNNYTSELDLIVFNMDER